jgi:hypothetical protein
MQTGTETLDQVSRAISISELTRNNEALRRAMEIYALREAERKKAIEEAKIKEEEERGKDSYKVKERVSLCRSTYDYYRYFLHNKGADSLNVFESKLMAVGDYVYSAVSDGLSGTKLAARDGYRVLSIRNGYETRMSLAIDQDLSKISEHDIINHAAVHFNSAYALQINYATRGSTGLSAAAMIGYLFYKIHSNGNVRILHEIGSVFSSSLDMTYVTNTGNCGMAFLKCVYGQVIDMNEKARELICDQLDNKMSDTSRYLLVGTDRNGGQVEKFMKLFAENRKYGFEMSEPVINKNSNNYIRSIQVRR